MATRGAVVVASDSVSRGSATDASGALAVSLLRAEGYEAEAATVVPDDAPAIAAAIRAAEARGARVVVVTGGTGIGPRDVTPEALRSIADKELPGIGEAIRAATRAAVPQTDLSRSTAATVGRAIVVAVPGSPGGVRDALAVALPLARHAVAMIDGGGHRPGPSEPAAPPKSASSIRPTAFAVSECELAVAHPSAGAIASFSGVVRDHDGGRDVVSLTYEAHPDADAVVAAVLEEARSRPGVLEVSALHRTGDLAVGDLAFASAASAAHRAEAFAACAWIVDQVKAQAPIWKHQRFADGTEEWVNFP